MGYWSGSPFSGGTYKTGSKPSAPSAPSAPSRSSGSSGSSGGGSAPTVKKAELKNVWLGGNGIKAQQIPGATQEEINRASTALGINPTNLQPTTAGLAHIREAEALRD